MTLTERDRDLLAALTQRVRVLTLPQVGRTWFGGTADPALQAGRRLRRLAAAGWVTLLTMKARPELELVGPLVDWRRGTPAPDFHRLARLLAIRWTEPIRPTALVLATATAGTRLGGAGGRRPRLSEVSHDITLAAVYLRWRDRAAATRGDWLSEARLTQLGFGAGTRLPDALVCCAERRIAIEVGGEYPPAKLRAFHDFCDGSGLDYELW